MNGIHAFEKLKGMEFNSVLDLGSGEGLHALKFREAGKKVTTISYIPPADYIGDYLEINAGAFDCIWASHVLEHQPNAGLFLKKCYSDLIDNGILAITVPPLKHDIVGGHLSLWNAGLLLYNLILSGFDCSAAFVKSDGYDISVIVRKKPSITDSLVMDFGDIEKIAHYFPFDARHGFDGRIQEINW